MEYLAIKAKAVAFEKCDSSDSASTDSSDAKDSEEEKKDDTEDSKMEEMPEGEKKDIREISGEISTLDQTYRYKDQNYYFDMLTSMPIDSDNKNYKIELSTSSFDPVLFIMRADGSKVEHTGKDVVQNGDLKTVTVEFTANSGLSLLISVETRNPGQLGPYTVKITKD